MNSATKDVNDKETVLKEAALESETILSSVYLEVKKWYNEQEELKGKFGEFPMFWQELSDWTPWSDVYSKYMKKTEADYKLQKQFLQPQTVDLSVIKSGKRKTGWGLSKDCYSKRSKWSQELNKSFDGLKSCIAHGLLTSKRLTIIQLRIQIEDLESQSRNLDKLVEKELLNQNRAPSPPPIYDAAGNKTNSLKTRILERLNIEKDLLMQEVVKLNPLYELGYSRAQLTKKVYIPYKEHPDCNFMGLLIGPRGQTLQKMEMQTGCKITVRGKGSLNGKRAKPESNIIEDDDELHVFICGDTQDQLNKAEDVVKSLLTVDPARWEEIKTKQLRALAKMNGTLKDETYCKNCGNPGHQEFECPTRQKTVRRVEVRCTFCGDRGHITKDCKFKSELTQNDEIDREYKDFLKEFGQFDDENVTQVDDNLVSFDLSQPNQNAVRAPINFGLTINNPSVATMQNMPLAQQQANPMIYAQGQWGYNPAVQLQPGMPIQPGMMQAGQENVPQNPPL